MWEEEMGILNQMMQMVQNWPSKQNNIKKQEPGGRKVKKGEMRLNITPTKNNQTCVDILTAALFITAPISN